MESRTVSVVIPAYNEEKRIGSTIKDIMENVENLHEIIVVFDGSDSTPEIVETHCPDCIIIQHNQRMGKGRAVKEGIGNAHGDIIAYVDAEGSVPASEIGRLCSLLNDENFIISSRWMRSSRVRIRQPLHRVIFGRVFHYFVFLLFRFHIKDTQCGLKIFRSESIKEVIQKVNIFDWSFDVSVIFHAIEFGLKPMEVGIQWNNEDGSKLRILGTIPKMFLSVFGMWLVNRRSKSTMMRSIIEKIHYEFFTKS